MFENVRKMFAYNIQKKIEGKWFFFYVWLVYEKFFFNQEEKFKKITLEILAIDIFCSVLFLLLLLFILFYAHICIMWFIHFSLIFIRKKFGSGGVTAARWQQRCVVRRYIFEGGTVCVCVDDGACGGGCASNRTQAFKYSYKRCAILLFIYRLHVSDVCLCLVWICVFSLTEGYVQNAYKMYKYLKSNEPKCCAMCTKRIKNIGRWNDYAKRNVVTFVWF